MSRYVQQRVLFHSSSSEEETSSHCSSKKSRTIKRKRPNRLTDNWKKVSPLKYISSSSDEDKKAAKPNKKEAEESIVVEKKLPATKPAAKSKAEPAANEGVVDTTRKVSPNKTGARKRRTQIF